MNNPDFDRTSDTSHNMQMCPEYLMRVVNIMALPKTDFPRHKNCLLLCLYSGHIVELLCTSHIAAESVCPDACRYIVVVL